jgi:hypothetical protein
MSHHFVKFVGYDRPYINTDHIVRALLSDKEVKFLDDWALTFAAVRVQPAVNPTGPVHYSKVVTATRDSWERIAQELDAHARSGNKSPDDMSSSQHHARAWCEGIRVRVLGKDIRYFGLG